MSLISKPFTFTTGQTINASDHNSNYDTIYNDYNGNITDSNISSSAAISDTKLAGMTSAGKVNGSSLTSLGSTPSNAGQLPSVNGGVPTGAIFWFPTTSAPTGYLYADGSAVSRTTYATLFALISTTYGAGDGTTTFNLPNLKGKVSVGYDSSQTEFDTMGETGGEKTHTLTTTELPAHHHTIVGRDVNTGGTSNPQLSNGGGSTADWDTQDTGSNGAHNNLQPYISLLPCIKY